MYILIIGSILLGAILERFFKVLVLIPACAVTRNGRRQFRLF
jgi:hypothetical protein